MREQDGPTHHAQSIALHSARGEPPPLHTTEAQGPSLDWPFNKSDIWATVAMKPAKFLYNLWALYPETSNEGFEN